ncbi:hypothetical protein AGOR_G00182070 [Albula goreensis]|uniref:ATP-dependent DNA helicase n=1 Tax=Albula goreensis TaxID=1534307 RepID=A0A8T3CWN4_9TELE|nr:hypothetical protein AGOR_G00182070 [Albula goreensis]
MEKDSVNGVQKELEDVESELEVVELQIAELLERQAGLNSRKTQLLRRLEQACDSAHPQPSGSTQPSDSGSAKQDLKRYEGTDFPWSKEVQKQLAEVFQLSKFRPLQLLAINLTMAGKDLFLVMPTGRGKSLCYQLPAVCSNGFTLVIAPLVSLMEDQLMYLKTINVSAVSLHASSGKEHAKWVLAGMTDQKTPFRLLYVTPEKISKSKLLMSKLEKAYHAGTLERIAVDEVHCCSQWGHDFRPDYKLLGILKRQFPKVPLIGLTATATSHVLSDCQKILSVPDPRTLTAPFNRPNLYYEVRNKDANADNVIDDIAKLILEKYKDQSGIVYVFSQKDAEAVSLALQEKGISASPYHANMEHDNKTRVHRQWTANKIQVVVATVAFGMGIDKTNVRFIIHHSISKSMENYYQESGRAGRDDKPADCIVYFGFADIFRISTMVVMENVGQQKLMEMVAYCQNLDRCRRTVMAKHFDEVWDDDDCNQMCDVCRHGNDYITVDITQHARDVVKIVEHASSMNEKVTPLKLTEAWMGKGPSKTRKMIQVTSFSRLEVEAIITHLLLQGYFSEDFSFTPYNTFFYVKLGRKAVLLKNDKHTITLKMKRNLHNDDSVKVSRGGTSAQTKGGKRSSDKAGDAPPKTKKVKAEEKGSAGEHQRGTSPHTFSRYCASRRESKFTKKTKNQQNQARKQDSTQSEIENQAKEQDVAQTESQAGEEAMLEPRLQLAAIEVDVEISSPEKDNGVSESVNPVPLTPPEASPFKSNGKRKSTPKKRRKQNPAESVSNTPPVQQGSALVSSPSEVSIISAAAVEELSDLRSYYSKQLQRINYISHECLHDSDSGILTCSRGPLKSLRLPWGSSFTRTVRSLWTRVSTRRKLIRR